MKLAAAPIIQKDQHNTVKQITLAGGASGNIKVPTQRIPSQEETVQQSQIAFESFMLSLEIVAQVMNGMNPGMEVVVSSAERAATQVLEVTGQAAYPNQAEVVGRF